MLSRASRPPMRLALLLLLAPGPASAAGLLLDAHDGYFTVRDSQERNPGLGAAAGREATVSLRNVGTQPHDFHVRGAGDPSIPCCVAPGSIAEVTFTVPPEAGAGTQPGAVAEYDYYCSVHEAQGMKGRFAVHTPIPESGPPPSSPIEAPPEARGVPSAATLAGLAALAIGAFLRRGR